MKGLGLGGIHFDPRHASLSHVSFRPPNLLSSGYYLDLHKRGQKENSQ